MSGINLHSIVKEILDSPVGNSEKNVDLLNAYSAFIKKINESKSVIINNFQNGLKKTFINKRIKIRAKKSNQYSVEQEYTILVKTITVSPFEKEYIIIFKDDKNVPYYLSNDFNPKIIESSVNSAPNVTSGENI